MSGWAGFSDHELRSMKIMQRKAREPRAPEPDSRQRDKTGRQAAGDAPQPGHSVQDEPLESPEEPAGEAAEGGRSEVRQSPSAEREESREIPEVMELEEQQAQEFFRNRLDQLQQQQTEMEEKNRETKKMLSHHLTVRRQQTQAEAAILATVGAELQQLETIATGDIIILRGRIEEADRHYSRARKRYEHAEAEFVASKLAVQRAAEAKQLLAEHLTTVIQHNELRKARKLEELMLRLTLGNTKHCTLTQEEEGPLQEEHGNS